MAEKDYIEYEDDYNYVRKKKVAKLTEQPYNFTLDFLSRKSLSDLCELEDRENDMAKKSTLVKKPIDDEEEEDEVEVKKEDMFSEKSNIMSDFIANSQGEHWNNDANRKTEDFVEYSSMEDFIKGSNRKHWGWVDPKTSNDFWKRDD